MRADGKDLYCIKTNCPNEASHKSQYCVACRTFKCSLCGKTHTITQAPHSPKLRLCAQCRRKVK